MTNPAYDDGLPPDFVAVDNDLRWIIQRMNDLEKEVTRLKKKVAYLESAVPA